MNPEIDSDRSLTEITIDPSNEKLYLIENNLVSPSLKETIILSQNDEYDYSYDSFTNYNASVEEKTNFITLEKARNSRKSLQSHSFKTSGHDFTYENDKNGNHAEIVNCKNESKLNDNYHSHKKEKDLEASLPNETKTSQNFYSKSKNDPEAFINEKTNVNDSNLSSAKQYKPMKALCQINSKSMNELNFIQEEKSNLNFGECSQSVEELFFKKSRPNENLETATASAFSKYHSTFNLIREEHGQNCSDLKDLSFNPLNRKKSHSLTSLSSFRKPNYSHVQSKVKQYIQERKRQETKERERVMAKSQSRSLPVTPMKQKTTETCCEEEIFLLDEKVLGSLTTLITDPEENIPEELKKLRYEMHDETTRLKILGTLISQLKDERKCRVDLGCTLNALQLDYDNLLAQFAQAKNIIDDMRLYKNAHEMTESSSPKSCHRHSSGFKKALSTSNIFSECSSMSNHSQLESVKPPFNLVKASFSPLVDPNISLTVKLIRGKDKGEIDSFSSNMNCNIEDKLNEKISTSSSENSYSAWIENYQYVYQKLKEYIILESNSALKEEERNIIWNFITEKYSELCLGYQTLKEETIVEHGCKKKIEEIRKSLETLSAQFGCGQKEIWIKKQKDDRTTIVNTRLPMNISNPSVDRTYSKHPTAKLILNDSRASSVRQMQPREVDSGYPASDRSARNSQFPSFDQSESLVNGICEPEASFALSKSSFGEREMCVLQSPDSRPDKPLLSHISKRHSLPLPNSLLGTEETIRWVVPFQHYCHQNKPEKTLNRNSIILDEEYDASGSSELDDSCEENRTRRVSKRRHPKVYRTVNSSSFLNKYEDRFVCAHRLKSPRVSETFLPISSKKILGLSQIEKNSKYFEIQVNGLKSKGLPRGKMNKHISRVVPSSSQSTPLKAVNKEFQDERFGTSSPASLSSSFLASPHSSNTPATSTPKSKETFVFPIYCKSCYVPFSEMKRHVSSDLQHKDIQKMKRSYSIPSLHNCGNACPASFIHIDYFNCQQKHSRNPLPCSCCCSGQAKMQRSAYKDKDSSLLQSLEKATSIAEAMRLSSRKVLGFLRADRPFSKQ